jgi:hypothetical protein
LVDLLVASYTCFHACRAALAAMAEEAAGL